MISFLLLALYFSLQITADCNNYTSPSKSENYTLDVINLIVNPDIASPIIYPNGWFTYPGHVNGWWTKVRYVEYIDGCVLSANWGACPSYGVSCRSQFMDTDSSETNQQYYQNFSLTAGREFQLKFDWVSEIPNNPDSTGMSVLWNGINIFTVYDGTCTLKTETFYLTSIDGNNQIVFQAMGIVDSLGILIRNILLQELAYAKPLVNNTNQTANQTSNQTSNFTTNSTANLTQNQTNANVPQPSSDPYSRINSLQYQRMRTVLSSLKDSKLAEVLGSFGSRQNLRFLLGYALEVNHLLLYNYHLRNSTHMAALILAGAKDLYDQKGLLLDHFIYPLLGTSPAIAAASHSLPAVTNPLPDHSQRPMSALLEGTDLLLLDLPVTLLFFAIGHLLFKALFRCRISLLFRQYSLWTYLLCVLLDGRVEIATFCFCSEALMLATSGFRRKAQAAAVLLGYFLVFSFAVASMLLYRAVSRRLRHVYQNCGNSLSSSFFMCYHFGLYNICLGFVHRLLLPFPLTQLCILMSIETFHIFFLLSHLLSNFYRSRILAFTLLSLHFTHFCFLISLFTSEILQSLEQIISFAQEYIFYSFLFSWGLSALVFLFGKICLIARIFFSKSAKVAPLPLINKQLRDPCPESLDSNAKQELNRMPREKIQVEPLSQNEISSLKNLADHISSKVTSSRVHQNSNKSENIFVLSPLQHKVIPASTESTRPSLSSVKR